MNTPTTTPNPYFRSLLSAFYLSPLLVLCSVVGATERYVSLIGGHISPFTNWVDAATNIQAAVDAASAGDAIWVTNGTYATGGRATGTNLLVNRVAVDKSLTVLSVNGPALTTIEGHQVPGSINGDTAIRCVYLTNGAVLSGFTLTKGATRGRNLDDPISEQAGGAVFCVSLSALVNNCVLTGNSATEAGGGAYSGTLTNCTLTVNRVSGHGAGASNGRLINCTLSGNSANSGYGGAAFGSTLTNCILTGNTAYIAGGAHASTLNNCILTGNSATDGGGAAAEGTLNNCTLSSNSAGGGGGSFGGILNNCTLTNNFASSGGGAYSGALNNCVLQGNSTTYDGGGAYESTLNGCAVTGNSARYGGGAYSGALANCTLTANSAHDGGGAYSSTLTNCTLTANSAHDGGGAHSGILINCTLVDNNATNAGGAAYSSPLTNCTLNANSAYDGGAAFSATLKHCTLVSNTAAWGGGASLSSLQYCTLAGNYAYDGGGADSCTLITCLLTRNSAYLDGGGASDSSLLACTLALNSAGRYGGGAASSGLTNCIVAFNSASQGSNYFLGNSLKSLGYCCTTPLPTNGFGNIAHDPLFLDPAAGNFRVQSNSPCINFGDNSPYTPSDTDLDGRPRIVGRTVDIGAYELDPRVNGWFLGWLQYYRLTTDGSADYIDSDNDGLNNWQEWRSGTNPTNATPVPQMLSSIPNGTNVAVTWQSVASAHYTLQYATNLVASSAFVTIASNIPGQPDTTTFPHTNAATAKATFYRVAVQ